ncbi:nucleotidyltransferase domain-containing protein [Rubrivirga sp.]|uniref:nucleotidyltransferase domain-containing protein n=1 Tax=Rubrivirga sp. TaxID=1885344 RepID=UPI003C70819D
MPPLVPPAFRLVQLAACSELSAKRASALNAAVSNVEDWNEVVRLGVFHKALPLLHTHLRDHPGVPDNVRSFVLNHARVSSRLSLLLMSEMEQIGSALEHAGVSYLVLKGPSLSQAYGGLSRRPFVDNDLLIEPADFGRVEDVLLSMGFRERKRSDFQQWGYLHVHGEYTFGRTVGDLGSTVDVHTRLAPFGYGYAPDVAALLSRARPVPVSRTQVPSLSWDDTVVALSVNALKDQWDRLRLAADIAAVAEFVDDWDGVLAKASNHRVRRALFLALLVSEDVADGRFPPELLDQARQDLRARRLAEYVWTTWCEDEATRPLRDRAKLTLLVQDGLVGQLRYAAYTAVRRISERLVATTAPQ